MGCKECGKPKCNGKCGCNSPKVLQINNPAEYITFHKVSIPAAMGDSTTNPPKIGAYRNALVYYEADHTSWMYSTDGIPTLVTGEQGETGPQGPAATVAVGTTTTGEPGTQARVYNSGTVFNAVLNFEIPRGDVGPQPELVQTTGTSTTKAMSQNATTEALNGKQNTLTAGSNIQISGSTISATDTKYSAGNGITLTGTQFSANTSVLATKNDLGSYYTKTQIDSQMAAKQDDLVAGSNIQIAPDGKTISATDTTYTAGNGLNLNGTEFSADTDVLATKEDLEDYYTKPEADNLLAPKLEAEVVAELPTTGTEGKLYLTPKTHTIQPATGNPITTTVTEEAGKIESFQLDGDTYQQASPNPDYPQPIQTVTGLQTISINSTDYLIDLGSIELCKLGTYQDYIYKDGNDWKVHKATVSAIIDGSESWSTSGTNTFYVADIYSKIGNSIQSTSTGEMYASHFTIVDISGSNTLVGASLKVDAAHNLSNLRIRLQDMSGGTAGFRQMLSAKKPSIYARRLTPTDTTITDSNLIAQLEAIRTASLENGTNTITNTATGSNLAGDMEIGYFETNPTNRYDKFIWLDLNNNYEQIGS